MVVDAARIVLIQCLVNGGKGGYRTGRSDEHIGCCGGGWREWGTRIRCQGCVERFFNTSVHIALLLLRRRISAKQLFAQVHGTEADAENQRRKTFAGQDQLCASPADIEDTGAVGGRN